MTSERPIRTIRLGPAFALRLEQATAPDREGEGIRHRVQTIWEAANRERSRPYTNGELLSLVRVDGDVWWAAKTDYMHFIAHRRDEELRREMGLNILAVSGLLVCANTVYVGRRSREMTQYPGAWELVPSGGLTPDSADRDGRIDLSAQLLVELREELGVSTDAVLGVTPLVALEDTIDGVTDVALRIELRSWNPTATPSGEYDDLAGVAMGDIPAFVGSRETVPTSLALLREAGLLPKR